MNNQDQKWVLRLYNYLQRHAPALWKSSAESNQPLVFRYAPIIKSQKGEWLSPYTDSGVLHIYLPLTSGNIDEYNIVSNEYCNEPNALAFFKELGIKEPDKLDYIKSIVLPKYNSSDISIEDDILKDDFNFVFSFYNCLETEIKQREFIQLILHDFCVKVSDNKFCYPSALYFKSPELFNYFELSGVSVKYFNEDFYKNTITQYGRDKVLEFLKKLGADEYPAIIKDEFYYLPERIASELESKNYVDHEVIDYYLHGFNKIIENGTITKETSLYLWNVVLPSIEYKEYTDMEVKCRGYYKRHKDSYTFMSTFQYSLINTSWLYDRDGILKAPANIFQEDLSEEYNFNPDLFNFLSIKPKAKSIIELGGTEQQQLEQQFGAEVLDLFAGITLSPEEKVKFIKDSLKGKLQALKKEQEKKKKAEQGFLDTPEPEQPEEKKTVEEKLIEKWERKAQNEVRKPHSLPTRNDLTEDFTKDTSVDGFTDLPVFDFTHKENKEEERQSPDDSKAEKRLKQLDTEAQKAAESASEQVEILEMLKDTPTYTYKWYKLLMELMHANKESLANVKCLIDFSSFELTANDKILHLSEPSKLVPLWITEADSVQITLLSENPESLDALIIRADEESIDLSVESIDEIEEKCSKAKRVRISAVNSSSFIDSLEQRFLQLGFEDEFDMNENLPKDIQFIYGPPGTGKTTKVVEKIKDLIQSDDVKNILVLTPTNKAADVVARKLSDDDVCYDYLSRFGATEDLYLIEDAAVLRTRLDMDLELFEKNIVVTSVARYAYDYFALNDEVFICDVPWDYIVIDEASMVDILSMTYVLYKGSETAKFIISGDPKQIKPVSQNSMPEYNIYDLVDLQEFSQAIQDYDRYPVEPLMTQYRSVPVIGNLVSKYSYNGLLKSYDERQPQKPLNLDGLEIKNINFFGFPIMDFDSLYQLCSVNDSAFHLYAAIFTYRMVDYVSSQIHEKYSGSNYSIGVVCPYKAEADAIKQMLENRPLDNDECTITCGTVHSFQGDECDIMFVVMNPPAQISSGSHINNQNIINVAMSRARDYLFFVIPNGNQSKFSSKIKLGNIVNVTDRKVMNCSVIERVLWGDENFIRNNTSVFTHMPVNVYCEDSNMYEVRISDTALDIKIHSIE